MKTLRKYIKLILILVPVISALSAAKIEKGTYELQGSIYGNYQGYQNGDKYYSIGISPGLAYYFSDSLFVRGSGQASYATATYYVYNILSLGIGGALGWYTRLSERLIFAVPVGMTYSGFLDPGSNINANGQTQYNYFLAPTLKFQIGENVVLGTYLDFNVNYLYRKTTSGFEYWFFGMNYGISWSYIW